METLQSVGPILALPAVILLFLRACSSIDEHVPQALVEFSGKILDKKSRTQLAVTYFLSCFDSLFCGFMQNRPKFWRCAAFSVGTYFAIFCAWLIWSQIADSKRVDDFFQELFQSGNDSLFPMTAAQGIFIILSLVVVVNVVGDYFSLCETRYILRKLEKTNSAIGMAVLWILDIAASVAFFAMSLVLLTLFSHVIVDILGSSNELRIFDLDTWTIAIQLPFEILISREVYFFSKGGGDVIFSNCLYTSLSTTIWVTLSVIAMRFWSILRVAKLFPMAKKSPFGALTAICILAIVFVVMAISGIGALAGK